MPLTVRQIEAARPDQHPRDPSKHGKPYKLADSGGLYLLVKPEGKYWRMKYRFAGKEDVLAFGVFPTVTLADARRKRDDAKRLLAEKIDPKQHVLNKQAEEVEKTRRAVTFRVAAEEWLAHSSPGWTATHAGHVEQSLRDFAYPKIGHKTFAEIDTPEVLEILTGMLEVGKVETASRVFQRIRSVFAEWALPRKYADRDTPAAVRATFFKLKRQYGKANPPRSMAAVSTKELPALLRAIDSYGGAGYARLGLKLLALTFVRPGELRQAKWDEFELESPEPMWSIPGERMKNRLPHSVPLSKQAVAVLQELKRLPHKNYVFPNGRKRDRCMAENTLVYALAGMGYKDKMTAHGFRSVASSRLNEMGFNPDAIERQLSHVEANETRAAYNRADYWDERVRMMQQYADWLDSLRTGGNVVPLKAA